MPDEQSYPRVMYHEDGQHRVVRNADEEKALGDGWSSEMNDNSAAGIRKAAGSIGEVIEPVQRTRPERTN